MCIYEIPTKAFKITNNVNRTNTEEQNGMREGLVFFFSYFCFHQSPLSRMRTTAVAELQCR